MEQGYKERFVKYECEVADHQDHLLCNGDLMNTKKSKFTPPQPTNPL